MNGASRMSCAFGCVPSRSSSAVRASSVARRAPTRPRTRAPADSSAPSASQRRRRRSPTHPSRAARRRATKPHRRRASRRRRPPSSPARRQTTPVEVSDCWQKTARAPASETAAPTSAGSGVLPHSYRIACTSSPCRSQISIQRSPKEPWLTTATRSPGAQRFATADSMAPVPDAVKSSTSAEVRKTSFSRPSALLVDLAEVGAAVMDDRLRDRPRAPRAAQASARA